MGRILTPRRALVLVMVVAAGYGAAMIRDTSFITGGKRYTTLHDDMMISMSYAANLVAGNGCVWTRGGERLMGITNPGWILVMTIPFLLGASKAAAPVFIEVLGLLLALGSAWFAGKIARKLSGSETVRLAATALVGMSYVLLQYSVLGFEVSALAFLITACVWLVVKHERAPWYFHLLLAVGAAIRLDFTPIALVFAGWLLWQRRGEWKWTAIAALAAVAVVLGASYAYYGNGMLLTARLKLTGFPVLLRIARGIIVTYEAWMSRLGLLLLLLPLIPIAIHRRNPVVWLVAGLAVVTTLYVFWVGSDAWVIHGRIDRWSTQVLPLWTAFAAWGGWELLHKLRQ